MTAPLKGKWKVIFHSEANQYDYDLTFGWRSVSLKLSPGRTEDRALADLLAAYSHAAERPVQRRHRSAVGQRKTMKNLVVSPPPISTIRETLEHVSYLIRGRDLVALVWC